MLDDMAANPIELSRGKARRRWWQFSLRTLLVVVAICGISLSWLCVKLRQAEQQRQVVDDLHHVAAVVCYDYQIDAEGNVVNGAEPTRIAWLRKLLGDDFFESVVTVSALSGVKQPFGDRETTWFLACPRLRYLYIHNGWITDAALARLSEATNLRVLIIGGPISDTGLAHICRCAQLKTLLIQKMNITSTGLMQLAAMVNLSELGLPEKQTTDGVLGALGGLTHLKVLTFAAPQVTDAGMIYVARFKELERLDLEGTAITDDGLKQLGGLTALRTVCLPERITDAGLESVGAWSKLEWLSLLSREISDNGLAHLTACKELRTLAIQSARVTDEGLIHLAKLHNLTSLVLHSPHITDAGIPSLETMTTLKSLTLLNSKITDEGAERLSKALPNTDIYPSPPSTDGTMR